MINLTFKQKCEIVWLNFRYGVPNRVSRAIMNEIGNKRKKLYAMLRFKGYEI